MNANNLYYTASSVPTYDIAAARTNEKTIMETLRLFNPHAQMNSHSFIFRLPTETLDSIFIDCARDYHSKDSGYPSQTVPSWVNVSLPFGPTFRDVGVLDEGIIGQVETGTIEAT
ncbi:hypothetical protein OG21DRAFT_1503324 [Imleria badia]|nr:hypothetical protein OG21DRAFT_1503324 [Imleria badia]